MGALARVNGGIERINGGWSGSMGVLKGSMEDWSMHGGIERIH